MLKISGEYRIDSHPFSVRTSNCLKNAGIRTLNQLLSMNETLLLRCNNIGRRTLNEISDFLLDHNLEYGTKLLDIVEDEYDYDYDTTMAELNKLQHQKTILDNQISSLKHHLYCLNARNIQEDIDNQSDKTKYPTIFSCLTEREEAALKHRINQKTYTQIASEMDVTAGRARELVEKCYKKFRHPSKRHLQDQLHVLGLCEKVYGSKCKYCKDSHI